MFSRLCLLFFPLGQSELAVGCLCEKEGYAFWQSNPPSKLMPNGPNIEGGVSLVELNIEKFDLLTAEVLPQERFVHVSNLDISEDFGVGLE